MIKVNVNSKEYEITMDGHAGYAEQGKDIVCAAASILLYTLADTLKRFESICDSDINIDDDNGKIKAVIKCTPKQSFEGNIQLVYQIILNGLQLLADGYPDNVKITFI